MVCSHKMSASKNTNKKQGYTFFIFYSDKNIYIGQQFPALLVQRLFFNIEKKKKKNFDMRIIVLLKYQLIQKHILATTWNISINIRFCLLFIAIASMLEKIVNRW